MLALIRREIEDCWICYAIILVISLGHAGRIAYLYPDNRSWPMSAIPDDILEISFGFLVAVLALITILDVFQRGLDQKERLSSFLSTLSPTRGQLLIARWVAMLVWLGCAVLPVMVTHVYYVGRVLQWGQVQYADILWTYLGLLGLAPIACYLLSQFVGLCKRPLVSISGSLLMFVMVVALVMIKGLLPTGSHQLALLLGGLALSSALGIWFKYHAVAL